MALLLDSFAISPCNIYVANLSWPFSVEIDEDLVIENNFFFKSVGLFCLLYLSFLVP